MDLKKEALAKVRNSIYLDNSVNKMHFKLGVNLKLFVFFYE